MSLGARFRDIKPLAIFAICIAAFGIASHAPLIATVTWWVAALCGLVLAIAWALDRTVGAVMAIAAAVLAVTGIAGPTVGDSARAVTTGASAGLMVGLLGVHLARKRPHVD